MNSGAVPIIRLEIESMKHAIMAAIGIEGSELEEIIRGEIDRALTQLRFGDIVEREIIDAVQKSVKSYFSFGDGHKAIEQAVAGMFKQKEVKT